MAKIGCAFQCDKVLASVEDVEAGSIGESCGHLLKTRVILACHCCAHYTCKRSETPWQPSVIEFPHGSPPPPLHYFDTSVCGLPTAALSNPTAVM
jgi:hypothetical protein